MLIESLRQQVDKLWTTVWSGGLFIRDINSNASFPAPANDPGTVNDPSQSSGPNA